MRENVSQMGIIKSTSQSKDNLSFAPPLHEKSINSMNTSNYESEEGEVFRFEYKIEQPRAPQSIKSHHPGRPRDRDSLKGVKNVMSLRLKADAARTRGGQRGLEPIPSESSRECHVVDKVPESGRESESGLDIESIVQMTTGNVIRMLKDNPQLLEQIIQKPASRVSGEGEGSMASEEDTKKQISDLVMRQMLSVSDKKVEKGPQPKPKKNEDAVASRHEQKARNGHPNDAQKAENRPEAKRRTHEARPRETKTETPGPRTEAKRLEESQGLIEMKRTIDQVSEEGPASEHDFESFIETRSFLESRELKNINKADISAKLTKSFSKILRLEDHKNLTDEICLTRVRKGLPPALAPPSERRPRPVPESPRTRSKVVQQLLQRGSGPKVTERLLLDSLNSDKGKRRGRKGELGVAPEQIMFSTLQPRTLPMKLERAKRAKRGKRRLRTKFNYKSEIDLIFKQHMDQTKQNRFFKTFLRSKSPVKRKSPASRPNARVRGSNRSPAEPVDGVRRMQPREPESSGRRAKTAGSEYNHNEQHLQIGEELSFIHQTLNAREQTRRQRDERRPRAEEPGRGYKQYYKETYIVPNSSESSYIVGSGRGLPRTRALKGDEHMEAHQKALLDRLIFQKKNKKTVFRISDEGDCAPKGLFKSDILVEMGGEQRATRGTAKKAKSARKKKTQKGGRAGQIQKAKRKYKLKRTQVHKKKRKAKPKTGTQVAEFTFTPDQLKRAVEAEPARPRAKRDKRAKPRSKMKKKAKATQPRKSRFKKKEPKESILTQFIENIRESQAIDSNRDSLHSTSNPTPRPTSRDREQDFLNTRDAELASDRPLLSTLTQSQQHELMATESLGRVGPGSQPRVGEENLAKTSMRANKDAHSCSVSKDITISRDSSILDSRNASLRKEELLQILLSKNSRQNLGETQPTPPGESALLRSQAEPIREEDESCSDTSPQRGARPSLREETERNETSFQNLEIHEESLLDKEIAQLEELERQESCWHLNKQIKRKIESSFGLLEHVESFVNFDNDRIQSLIQARGQSRAADFIEKRNRGAEAWEESVDGFEGPRTQFKTFAESEMVLAEDFGEPLAEDKRRSMETSGEVGFLKQINQSLQRDLKRNSS